MFLFDLWSWLEGLRWGPVCVNQAYQKIFGKDSSWLHACKSLAVLSCMHVCLCVKFERWFGLLF